MTVIESLLLTREELRAATGWELKPEGLCRGDVCVPVRDRSALERDGRIDVRAFAAALQRPLAVDDTAGVAVLGEPPDDAAIGQIDDLALPDADGNVVQLSELGPRRKLVFTWASWCGCRYDLPSWSALNDELRDHDFTVVGIALDEADAAREWIDAADPSYPVLIDADHVIAERLGIFNVPSAVWIEDDRVVRPPVIAPGDDQWREFTGIDSAVHHEQLRAWVREGTLPFDDEQTKARLAQQSADEQLARAERRLGAYLFRTGRTDLAEAHFARAAELAPYDFTIRRGTLPMRGGDPFGDEFFAFVEEWMAAGSPGYKSADAGD